MKEPVVTGINDLWELGCTVYQMLSGTSPFKDAKEARDLIDQLLSHNANSTLYSYNYIDGFILQCIRPQMAPRKLSE
ncbi:hypothetical protein CsSME_00038034 [Camellia sinensis var. sinensis]